MGGRKGRPLGRNQRGEPSLGFLGMTWSMKAGLGGLLCTPRTGQSAASCVGSWLACSCCQLATLPALPAVLRPPPSPTPPFSFEYTGPLLSGGLVRRPDRW